MKWSQLSESTPSIAVVLLSDFGQIAADIACLFGEGPVEYSGVILGNDGTTSIGDSIEKSCYARGGYKFLVRDFGHAGEASSHSTVRIIQSLLVTSAEDYANSVLGRANAVARLESLWAVCQRDGDYATIHHHIPPGESPGRRLSGMLYLLTPQGVSPATFPNGCLHFIAGETVVYCPPVPGSLVLWPSELLHGVHPFRGPGDRLGVSFNMVLE